MEKQPGIGIYRWKICAMLFLATTINFVDRQVLGILAPQLQKEFAWSDSEYGFIVSSFQAAYAIGFSLWGICSTRLEPEWEQLLPSDSGVLPL